LAKLVKVSDDTHTKLTASAKWGESLDVVIQRLVAKSRGLEDVIAAESKITLIDGVKGRLLYRGYDINDLAANSNYEETAFLLWNSRLPTEIELQSFEKSLTSKRALPKELASIVNNLPANCDAMDALRVGVAALGIYDDPMYSSQEKAASIASKVGTLVALIHRRKHDLPSISPKEDLSFASNFLYMTTGNEPDELKTRLMNVILILHADHELAASTFAARVVASTLSDIYSAVTAAVGALKGPLHGGANEKVVEMTEEIQSSENVDSYVQDRLAKKQKVMGFGHRVYKTMDPRAKILKEYATELISSEQDKEVFGILNRVQEIMQKEKNLYPNVDLYSGFVLNHLGIPSYLFTPVFAVGRAPGWLAHILEQYADNRIIRPTEDYTGPLSETYVPIESRGGAST
jgi:citrate synthase